MKISTALLLVLLQGFAALGVYLDARRRPGRKIGFDVAVAFVVPVVGIFLYLSTTRAQRRAESAAAESRGSGLPAVISRGRVENSPPAGDPHATGYVPDPSLVAELTAEVRRLRAELGATREERDAALKEVKRLSDVESAG